MIECDIQQHLETETTWSKHAQFLQRAKVKKLNNKTFIGQPTLHICYLTMHGVNSAFDGYNYYIRTCNIILSMKIL